MLLCISMYIHHIWGNRILFTAASSNSAILDRHILSIAFVRTFGKWSLIISADILILLNSVLEAQRASCCLVPKKQGLCSLVSTMWMILPGRNRGTNRRSTSLVRLPKGLGDLLLRGRWLRTGSLIEERAGLSRGVISRLSSSLLLVFPDNATTAVSAGMRSALSSLLSLSSLCTVDSTSSLEGSIWITVGSGPLQ